ncbi:MAG: hypothetical protein R2705_08880 [Ilumatobacteraceae bacterium]
MLRPVAGGEPTFVEVQGTAEGMAFRREQLDQMLALAEGATAPDLRAQAAVLAEAPASRSLGR